MAPGPIRAPGGPETVITARRAAAGVLNVLTIAGSDPSSGAGVQGDAEAITGLGCRCLTAVTAVTAQGTSGFRAAEPVSPRLIRAQIASVLSDFEVGAVKVGMLYDRPAVRAVSGALRGVGAPVVADPVMRSTTGGTLLRRRALPDYRRLVVPLADAITPNVEELGALAGRRPAGEAGAWSCAAGLRAAGARNVVVTGVAGRGRVSDLALLEGGRMTLSGPRIRGRSHGGGCRYSAALAALLALGRGMEDAVRGARRISRASIAGAERAGRGIPLASGRAGGAAAELLRAALELAGLDGIAGHIPECQTNIVLAGPRARSARGVLGIDGRIVRAGGGAAVAGRVAPGGSRHVAEAVLRARARFPSVRSAANIRYDERTVEAMRGLGMGVRSYDRSAEPAATRAREGASVRWGVGRALRGARRPPDAVYHEGGHGKEPMIVVFGTRPGDVVGKVARVIGAAGAAAQNK